MHRGGRPQIVDGLVGLGSEMCSGPHESPPEGVERRGQLRSPEQLLRRSATAESITLKLTLILSASLGSASTRAMVIACDRESRIAVHPPDRCCQDARPR